MNHTTRSHKLFWSLALVLSLFCIQGYQLWSQTPPSSESPLCFTDRDVYFAGEEIWIHMPALHRYAMIELMSHDEQPIQSRLIRLEEEGGQTFMSIPGEIVSGMYYLRAWFPGKEQHGSMGFFYRHLLILNPFTYSPGDFNVMDSISRNTLLYTDLPGLELYSDELVKGMKDVYEQREEVSLQIEAGMSWAGSFMSITVTREILLTPYKMGYFEAIGNAGGEGLTDRMGESFLFGAGLSDPSTGQPLDEVLVYSAPVGKHAGLHIHQTNEDGRFGFTPEGRGDREFVFMMADQQGREFDLEIQTPLTVESAGIKTPDWSLSGTFLEPLNKAFIGMQVNQLYHDFKDEKREEFPRMNFYGDPDETVVIDEFIELPVMEEVIREIVPFVYFRKRKDNYELRVLNKASDDLFENQPLILVDGVPVRNTNAIMAINPRQLERIEVIYYNYYLGSQVFNGILHFVSREGKLNLVDEEIIPGERRLLDLPYPKTNFRNPRYPKEDSVRNRIPDLRNTLYLNLIRLNKKGKSDEISFFTSDDPGDYTLKIEGIDREGSPIVYQKMFRISDR